MFQREERTKKAADLCNSGIFHNNNNSINKGAIDSSLINKQQHKTPGSDDSAWKRLGGEVSDLKNHATCTVLGRDRAVGPIDYPSSHNHNNSHSSLNNFVFSLEQCDHQHKQTVDDLTIRIYYQNKVSDGRWGTSVFWNFGIFSQFFFRLTWSTAQFDFLIGSDKNSRILLLQIAWRH